MHETFKTFLMAGAALTLCAAVPATAGYQAQIYDLPAQSLGDALRAVARSSGQSIIVPTDLVAGERAPALKGEFSPEAALAQLLAGTGLIARRVGDALVIQRIGAESTQDAQGTGEGAGDQSIVVTGTRIRGRAPAGSAVTVIDRKAIDQSGYATAQQILQALPQNFGGGATEASYTTGRNGADANATFGSGINLRGLGPSSTLVLLNGERPPMAGFAGVFTDLSMVPVSVVERIEVLPDGASALYGSDAVAGVVNIVPRNTFRGLETSANIGSADGYRQVQASAIAGFAWNGGHAVLGYEYYDRGALAARERAYFSEDLRRFGLGDYRTAPGIVPVITAGGRTYVVPANQDGTHLTAADLVQGPGEKSDAWAGADALPAQRRHSLFASLDVGLADRLRFTAQGLFGSRQFDAKGRTFSNASAVTVPVTNPFYVDPVGTHLPVRVAYSFLKELGAEGTRGTSEAIGGTAALHWTPGSWDVSLSATYGRQREDIEIYNIVNTAQLAAALADPNRTTALNVFGNGTANNPATLDKLRGYYFTGGTYTMWSAALRADGALLSLPAGDLRLALGAEHRRERYLDPASDYYRTTLTPIVQPGSLNARRDVTAAYAELSAPLSGKSGTGLRIGQLDLSGAIRAERYSDFGTTVNPRVGLSWLPVDMVRLRGTFGTSFRAPSFTELQQGPGFTSYFAYPLADPAAPGGTTNALIIAGNDPDMGPERPTSWTAGLDFRPDASRGLTAQLTYFEIRYRDRITNPGAAAPTFLTNRAVYAALITMNPDPAVVAGYFASPFYANYFGIPASQVTAIIDARRQNLALQRQRALDFDLGYRFDLAGGAGEIGASGAYIFDYSQKLTETAPRISLVGTLGYPPAFKLRGRALYSNGGSGLAVFTNYLGGYSNNSTGPIQHVDSWLTFDVQLSHAFRNGPLGKLRVALSVSNLLDADPPLTVAKSTLTTLGIDLENASPVGRMVSLQVSKQW
ncbi:TonB-dependent receptor [Sphingomonas sp. KR3-1]|uniref:TonB-dependent receptor n=1 Tax=Sphingomonas sp. KR3-1 TaxID=3156611 RepID=UPI0032B3211E